ncbi:protein CHP02058 [Lupinus albus]|uniref:Protein CHP02058 n=1 Tax=Lupinus albus TaxID=3870 RepID=A0A6A4QJG7_LUPAL|nr:protein CHP02058 [Lupinus albus]
MFIILNKESLFQLSSNPTFAKQQFLISNFRRLFPTDSFPSTYFFLSSKLQFFKFPSQPTRATMEIEPSEVSGSSSSMKLLFVEMGVGYDQHGQNITSAAMRACRDAISSNSIPAFRRGSIPGVSFGEMKLQIKLGVPHSLQTSLDIEKVKSVFPYGKILNVEVVDGGLICSSGVYVEEMGDKNDDCYIVNAAVYVGY